MKRYWTVIAWAQVRPTRCSMNATAGANPLPPYAVHRIRRYTWYQSRKGTYEEKNTLILFIVLVLSLVSGASCTPPQPSLTPTATVPGDQQPVDPLTQRLDDLRFQEFGDALGTGVIPPDMASFRNNPTSALGAFFAKVAKSDKTCTSPDASDFVLVRITGLAPVSTCSAEAAGPTEFEERTVKGGVEAGISYVVGEAGTNDTFAFEFHITNPMVAFYPASQECVDTDKIVTIPPPPQTCDILFVTGATLTQATYRQYVEIEATARYNAVVNIEGKAYGSSSSMQSRRLLTVDFITLRNWFVGNEDGFLQAQSAPETALNASEMRGLTPEEFERMTSLSDEEKAQLHEISIESSPAVQ